MLAGSKDLRLGTWGKASDIIKVRFQQLGHDALYGWVLEDNYLGMDGQTERYFVLMPQGKTMIFAGNLPKYEENCSVVKDKCHTVKYDLTFDKSNDAVQPYPIVLLRSGTRSGRTIPPRSYRIVFDEGRSGR